MVERFNRSLLQLLRAYVDRENDWEKYLPLVLYAYRCAVHSSTGYSPFQLMYGRTPSSSLFDPQTAFTASDYYNHIRNKLAQLQDFVETNLSASASQQKSVYDHHTSTRQFAVGDPVWLSVPTAGKLDPRWEGRWEITAIKSPTNVKITDGRRTRVVHINRIQHRIQPRQCQQNSAEESLSTPPQDWAPPQIDQLIIPPSRAAPSRDAPTRAAPMRRYPCRGRHPPDYYGY